MTSTIKVDNIQNQCGANIINESSNTITIGASGDTVSLASGASATGFSRTGTVDWDTTVKTAGFTSVSGNGYFVNTTSGSITVNLPAGSAGDIVAFKDYANTWDTNNVTVTPNGSDKINGNNANATLDTESQSVTLIFVDSTKGWLDIHDSTSDVTGATFIAATGGTVLTCGNFKTHVFTGPGTFCVSQVGNPAGSTTVEYMVVAGGGSGGNRIGGGGGSGGFRQNFPSPISAGLPVSATGYPITVGGGGSGIPDGTSTSGYGPDGSNSVFSTITSAGGGAGGPGGIPEPSPVTAPGKAGGSGGGGAYFKPSSGGAGNTPPVSPPQGNNGGSAPTGPSVNSGGGGGGAGATGGNGSGPVSGPGGIGSNLPDAFFGPTAPSYGTPGPASSTRYFAGGGGGGAQQGSSSAENEGTPTVGGGGSGRQDASKYDGTTNTGGGGGGGGLNSPGSSGGGGLGGSGIVVIRYKFQ